MFPMLKSRALGQSRDGFSASEETRYDMGKV